MFLKPLLLESEFVVPTNMGAFAFSKLDLAGAKCASQ
jgi:hypothetical protein